MLLHKLSFKKKKSLAECLSSIFLSVTFAMKSLSFPVTSHVLHKYLLAP